MNKEVFLIVGLGKPGPEYAHTRHNAGFEVMSLLEKHYGVSIDRKMLHGLVREVTEGDRKLVLCRPQTFMNNSGECVRALLNWYHADPANLLVVYDDIDLPPGRVRLRKSGGPGTHNGMRSILASGVGEGFPRLRIGTGDRPAGFDLADWVLSRPRPGAEQELMEEAVRIGAETAVDWVNNGIDHAMRLCAALQAKKTAEQSATEET